MYTIIYEYVMAQDHEVNIHTLLVFSNGAKKDNFFFSV